MEILKIKVLDTDGSVLQRVALTYKPKKGSIKKRTLRLMEQLAFVKAYLLMDPFQKVDTSWRPTAV